MKRKILGIVTAIVMGLSLIVMPTSIKAAATSITLSTNRTESISVASNEECVLDLNGYVLSGAIDNKGILTIKDSSGGKGMIQVANNHAITNTGTLVIENGTVDALSHAKGAVVNEVGGKVTINNGKFIRSNEAPDNNTNNSGGNSWYVLYNHGDMIINNADVSSVGHFSSLVENGWANGNDNKSEIISNLSINGGTFTGGINTIKNDDYGNLVITNGKFSNTTQHAVLTYNIAEISGGYFESDSIVIVNTKLDDKMDKGELKIKGGTFVSTTRKPVLDYNHNYTNGNIGKVEISAGTFSSSVSEYLTSDVNENLVDGSYKVAPKATGVTLSSDTALLEVGETTTLTATLAPAATLDTVSWKSSNEKIATVENGKVTAVAPGTTEISATVNGKTAKCTVTVYKVETVTTPTVDTTKPVEEVTVGVNDKTSQDVISEVASSIINDIKEGKDVTGVDSETANKLKEAADAGKTITTEVRVEKIDADKINKEAKETIIKLVSEETTGKKTTTIVEYLDLSILLKADGVELGTVNELGKEVAFTVAIPEELVKEGRVFYVVRVHEGVAEKLPVTLNEDGTITFKTDKFSTYALVYEDGEKTTPTDNKKEEVKSKVDTGDTTNTTALITLMGLAIVVAGGTLVSRKRASK